MHILAVLGLGGSETQRNVAARLAVLHNLAAEVLRRLLDTTHLVGGSDAGIAALDHGQKDTITKQTSKDGPEIGSAKEQ